MSPPQRMPPLLRMAFTMSRSSTSLWSLVASQARITTLCGGNEDRRSSSSSSICRHNDSAGPFSFLVSLSSSFPPRLLGFDPPLRSSIFHIEPIDPSSSSTLGIDPSYDLALGIGASTNIRRISFEDIRKKIWLEFGGVWGYYNGACRPSGAAKRKKKRMRRREETFPCSGGNDMLHLFSMSL